MYQTSYSSWDCLFAVILIGLLLLIYIRLFRLVWPRINGRLLIFFIILENISVLYDKFHICLIFNNHFHSTVATFFLSFFLFSHLFSLLTLCCCHLYSKLILYFWSFLFLFCFVCTQMEYFSYLFIT